MKKNLTNLISYNKIMQDNINKAKLGENIYSTIHLSIWYGLHIKIYIRLYIYDQD